MPEAKPEVHRKRTKDGFVNRYVSIPQAAWDKITEHIDDNDLDEKRFLTRLLTNAAEALK
jgi:hypothetical protein